MGIPRQCLEVVGITLALPGSAVIILTVNYPLGLKLNFVTKLSENVDRTSFTPNSQQKKIEQ